MKKIAFMLALILIISAPLTVSAATYVLTIRPVLSFSGTTATCEVTVVGDYMSDHIEVEMKLMHGSTCLATWYKDGYGYVNLEKTATVVKGETYEIVVAVTMNDVSRTPVSKSGTC
jgi:type 1 fimbria pilin